MTDQDKPAFAQAMNRLCIATRESEPDAIKMRVYYEALKALEIEFVVAAASALETGAEWFPKAKEWRDVAIKVERERTEDQRAFLRKLPSPLCLACNDTGWANRGAGVVKCDCARQRRLELLGRRPMPALPAASEAVVLVDAEVIARVLASTKGVR